jgi:repressor LexA
MRDLTDRQRSVLEAILDEVGASGTTPTIRELGARLGIRSTNGVADHLRALQRKGWLRAPDGGAHRIKLARPYLEVVETLASY